MFKFLKKTLGKALGKFKKDVEKEAEVVEEVEEPIEKSEPKKIPKEKLKPKEEPKKVSKEEPKKKPEKLKEAKKAEKKEVKEKPKKVVRSEKEEAPKPKKKEPVRETKTKKPKPEKEPEQPLEEEPEPKEEPKKKTKQEPTKEPEAVLKEEPKHEPEIKEKPKRRGFLGLIKEKVTKFRLSEDKFNDLFWDLEVGLLENNVAVKVIEKIKDDLKVVLTGEPIPRNKVEKLIANTLRKSIEDLFKIEGFDLIKKVKTKKPFIIAVIGVNGSGKTTTLAKLVHLFQKNKISCVVAASDTFRAAAIQQLEEHTNKLGVKLIKSDYKADPAAVAFDAVEHAKAKGIDIVLIDTAGRLHSNTNLMEELKKVIRVSKPDLKLFVGESITGNDCVKQAKVFDELVGIDGIILSKADVDEKGGAAISVSYITKKPILYLGTGQTYDDLKPFEASIVVESLGF